MIQKKYLKRYICYILILFLTFSYSVSATINNDDFEKKHFTTSNYGKTLYVGGSGLNNYTKIQDAIKDSVDGDTVFVYDDSSPYYENVVVDKSISLIGENRDTTVIDGNFKNNIVNVKSDNVIVSSFTLRNSRRQNAWEYNCVVIKGYENVTIENNIITIDYEQGDWIGCVYLSGSSYNNIKNNVMYSKLSTFRKVGVKTNDNSNFNNISGNEMYAIQNGVQISTSYNMIYNNFIYNCIFGIDTYAESNYIIKNRIINNEYIGILVNYGNDIISDNIITDNGRGGDLNGGIRTNGDNIQITYNYILNNNGDGVEVYDNYNSISNNHFSNNTRYGIFLDYSYYNDIFRNNFFGNGKDAYFVKQDPIKPPWKYKNNWDSNYWRHSRLFPYLIHGKATFFIFTFNWFEIDWHPAKEPYDI